MRIVKDGRGLASALDKIGDNLKEDIADKVMQKLSLDAYRFAIQRTPVRTGFLKSRWALTTGQLPPTEKNTGGTFLVKPPSVSRIKMGDKVTLYNNAEYASYVDEGTPNMRAQAMIQPTYQFVLGQADRLASALSKELAE